MMPTSFRRIVSLRRVIFQAMALHRLDDVRPRVTRTMTSGLVPGERPTIVDTEFTVYIVERMKPSGLSKANYSALLTSYVLGDMSDQDGLGQAGTVDLEVWAS